MQWNHCKGYYLEDERRKAQNIISCVKGKSARGGRQERKRWRTTPMMETNSTIIANLSTISMASASTPVTHFPTSADDCCVDCCVDFEAFDGESCRNLNYIQKNLMNHEKVQFNGIFNSQWSIDCKLTQWWCCLLLWNNLRLKFINFYGLLLR